MGGYKKCKNEKNSTVNRNLMLELKSKIMEKGGWNLGCSNYSIKTLIEDDMKEYFKYGYDDRCCESG